MSFQLEFLETGSEHLKLPTAIALSNLSLQHQSNSHRTLEMRLRSYSRNSEDRSDDLRGTRTTEC